MSAIFFFMLFFVLMADGLMVFLTPVLVYQFTGSIEYSGLSYALWWLPRIIIIPLIGKYIDRVGVRPLSIFTDFIKITGCIFLAFSNFTSDLETAIAFGIVGSIISIGNSQTLISYEKIISVISQRKEHHVNLISRMDFLGMILGPLIGMVFIEHGYRVLLIFPCLFYLTNAIFFFKKKDTLDFELIHDEKNLAHHACKSEGIKHIFLYIFSTSIIMASVIMAVGNNMFDGLVESTGAALIDQVIGLPVKYFGFIEIAAGIFGVAGTYIYSAFNVTIKRKYILLISIILIILSSLTIVLFPSYFYVFVGCYAISIIGKVFTGNIFRIIRIEVIPIALYARTSSVIVLLNQSILPLVGLIIYFYGNSPNSIYIFMVIAITISSIAGVCMYRLIEPLGQKKRIHV